MSTDHFGVIRVKIEELLPEYLMIQIEIGRHKYGFNRCLRNSLKIINEVSIKIPFNSDGSLNIEKNNEVMKKYEYVNELKNKIAEYKNHIFELIVDVEK